MSDRVIVYQFEQATESHVLQAEKNALAGIGRLAWATVGGVPTFHGLALSASSPAALTLVIGGGSFYLQGVTDATAYSTLGTDATVIIKQGIFTGPQMLSFPAPGTGGQSINYLVQALVADADTGSVVLPYYNSENPSVAYAGPGNSNTSQPTIRSTAITITVKAGTAATTGIQTTPAPDAGNYGLWVVTVANGVTTLGPSNAVAYSGTERLSYSLAQLQDNMLAVLAAATVTADPTNKTLLYTAIMDLINAAVAGGAPTGATETLAGILRFATSAEVLALSSTSIGVSPGELNTLNASTSQKGILKTAAPSDVNTGSSTDIAVTPASLIFSSNSFTNTNGSHTHPGGFIEKWGYIAPQSVGSATGTDVPITFATAFPTSCDNISLTVIGIYNATGSIDVVVRISGGVPVVSASGFTPTLVNRDTVNPFTFGAYWRAIGH